MISRSNPSIKFIAFVIPTIHKIVRFTEKTSCSSGLFINGIVTSSIFIPNDTAIIAATTCPDNFTIGFIPFISSIIQVIAITIIPKNIPRSLVPYFSGPNKSIVFSMLITISK